jgi:hypothetical protein
MAPTDSEASVIARAFALTLLDVDLCEIPPDGLYGSDPTTKYLFSVRYRRLRIVGASDYTAMARPDGRVRLVERAGE